MNRKFLNYGFFLAVVALVIGLAVRHSQYMRSLVDGMAGTDSTTRVASVRALVASDQFMDAITGEPVNRRVAIVQALEDWGLSAPPAEKPAADAKAALPSDAVKQIISFMKDPDAPVRNRLLVALVASATRSEASLTNAVAGLKEADANARKSVVGALQVVGQVERAKAADLLAHAAPASTAAQRDHALASIKPEIAQKLIAQIASAMKDAPEPRVPGGDVLGALPHAREQAVAALMPLLVTAGDKNADLRMGAADALGKVGSKTPVPALVQMMAKDTVRNRRIAVVAIAMIADASGEAALEEALANPKDDSEGRIQAALGLGRIGTPTATAALTRALTDYDLRVVAAAVTGLATAGAAALPSLETSTRSTDANVRLHSVEALGRIASPAGNAALAGALNGTDVRVALAAARSLGFAGNTGAVAALVAHLGGADSALATACADALALIGPTATPSLVASLGRSEAEAYFAARALSRMGAGAVASIHQAAATGGTTARWSAVALGGIGGPDAVAALRTLHASADPGVRLSAEASLQRLGVL